jgi:hypothetical protein
MLKNKPKKTKSKLPPPKKKAPSSKRSGAGITRHLIASDASMAAAQLVGAAVGGFMLAVSGKRGDDDDWHLVTDALPIPGTSVLLTVRGEKLAVAARAVSPISWASASWERVGWAAGGQVKSSDVVSWRLMPPAGPQ